MKQNAVKAERFLMIQAKEMNSLEPYMNFDLEFLSEDRNTLSIDPFNGKNNA